MRRMIQLRGANACGKTTAVNQFIRLHDLQTDTLEYRGKNYELQTDGRIYVIAKRRDDGTYGGLDGYVRNRDELVNVLIKVLKVKKPEILVFEGLVYGLTYKLGCQINEIAKSHGYHYTAVCLYLPLNEALERLYKRNGGKPINEETLTQKGLNGLRAYTKLSKSGIDTRLIDTADIPKDKMYKLIEDEI